MSGDVEAAALAIVAARAADEKTATDVVVLDVGEILNICEVFVICSARNARQIRAIADNVELLVHQAVDRKPDMVEGLDDPRWVLLDYGTVIVHIFLEVERDYYRLDRLYSDAPVIEWTPASA
jgi:ribosome-associated protein